MKNTILALSIAVALSAGATVYAVSTNKPAPTVKVVSSDPPPDPLCPPLCGR